MITAWGGVEAAVQAVKLGANDYVSKPWDNDKLIIEIERVIARPAAARREHAAQAHAEAALQLPQHRGQERPHARGARPGVAGGAKPFDHSDHRRNGHRQGTDRQGDSLQFAAGRLCVRGGEQRLAADRICWNPPYSDTCGALSPAPIQNKKGAFEVANKGTIFFDEVGTIGPETQAKLLRVIQEKEFTPLGSNEVDEGRCADTGRD